jgi:trans-aconitate methyltransferase
MNESLKTWGDYYKENANKEISPILKMATEYVDVFGVAVDVGSGDFTDTNFLAAKFNQVIAIDPSKGAREMAEKNKKDNVDFYNLKIEDFEMSQVVDLVNAQLSLQYVPRDIVEDALLKILFSLKRGGLFVGTIVGDNDSWKDSVKMSTLSRDKINKLFSDFEIIEFFETEEDGRTRLGTDKHWHLFRVIAKKK